MQSGCPFSRDLALSIGKRRLETELAKYFLNKNYHKLQHHYYAILASITALALDQFC